MHTGSCLCGAIEFEVSGELNAPDGCHCDACRKSTGHFLVSTDVKKDDLKISGEENISWFQSSEKVRRGFCLMCGSTLFFDAIFKDWTGVAMGAFDKPTNTKMDKHIFTAEKGDYYDIADGLPQNEH
ncbi:GFA family protein [Maritalea sp.]|uniref:GFA family protein n=1 Tax=Maritalea sp. TaxID=2003361 RepID=UPI003EF5008A